MKLTGRVRKLDQLGRVVLPIELRKTLNMILLRFLLMARALYKYEPACIFYSSVKDNVVFKGRIICADCIDRIKGI